MIEQEFQDIIILTAMMTKRVWRRKEEIKMESEEPLEIMLEEKSQKSIESGTVSDSSGSGPDIMGTGHSVYENQKKGKRKLGLFRGQHPSNTDGNAGDFGNLFNSKERFDVD